VEGEDLAERRLDAFAPLHEGATEVEGDDEGGKGPSQGYLVGQVASGANWKDKSASEALTRLKTFWLHPQPVSVPHIATFIPFDVSQNEMNRETSVHGYIVSRLRLPAKLNQALELSKAGPKPIDRIDALDTVRTWVDDVLKEMRQTIS
jgi:hypothetical protein